MANKDYLNILQKGIQEWNKWRKELIGDTIVYGKFFNKFIDLSGADLYKTNLNGANLSWVDLSGANLRWAKLSNAELNNTILDKADLEYARLNYSTLADASLVNTNFYRSNFFRTDIRDSNFSNANLKGATIANATLRSSNLSGANLFQTELFRTDLTGVNLDGADLSFATIAYTNFGNIDLSSAKGLETVVHKGPTTIGIDTIYLSKGKIPKLFLRGAGIPDEFINYMHSLKTNPIEFYSCFISYSSKNQDFAERLYADLQNNGVRCWFAPEDLKIGDKTRDTIDESIHSHDKLLLVFSEYSVGSNWVEHEVEAALEREQIENRLILFPIRLDDTVMETKKAWAANIRRIRNIGDFRNWKNHDDYQKGFARVLRDLKQSEKER
jgi:uncharacterized protein YjbI with pentapeptide repeats